MYKFVYKNIINSFSTNLKLRDIEMCFCQLYDYHRSNVKIKYNSVTNFSSLDSL